MRYKVFSCLIILSFFLLLCSCSVNKVAKTSEEFLDFFSNEDLNYYVENITNQFENDDIQSVSIAVKLEKEYQIEFLEFNTIEKAMQVYEETKEKIDKLVTNSKGSKEINYENANKYSKKNEDIYSIVSRIDNTIVYSKCSIDDMQEIGNIIKDLGY